MPHLLKLILKWWVRRIVVYYEDKETFEKALREKPVLILPNHISFLDGPIIWGQVVPAHFVAKKSLEETFLGRLLSLGGTLFLKENLQELKEPLRKKLLQKIPVGVFVEGGRSLGGPAKTPKAGLLKLILEILGEENLLEEACFVVVGLHYKKIPELKGKRNNVFVRVGRPQAILGFDKNPQGLAKKVIEEAYSGRTDTVPQIFLRACERYQNQTALLWPEPFGVQGPRRWQKLSWLELKEYVLGISKYLWQEGLRPGEKIAIDSKARPEWEILDLASILFGAVTVGIHPSLTIEEAQKIAQAANAKFFFDEEKLISIKEWRKDSPPKIPEWEDACKNLKPDDALTIIYTSGTTDKPKGIELTHKNIASIVTSFPPEGKGPPGTLLIYLPLSHILQRAALYRHLVSGTIAAYGTLTTLRQDLKEVRPTSMAAVPEILCRIQNRILEYVNKQNRLKRKVLGFFLPRIIHNFFGGRLRYIGCGGAALPYSTAKFFHDCGVLVLEGYGLSETSAPVTVNAPQAHKLGTVGKPFPGVTIKIADDGEILVKSSGLSQSAILDEEGWFHTGDCGHLDEEGFLIIMGRKKEILVTSGGEKIHPRIIEERLQTHPWVERAFVFGEQKPCLVCLIELNEIAKKLNREIVTQTLQNHIEKVNQNLASFEQIKNFAIIEGAVSPEKKIRQEVLTRHQKTIEELYGKR